MKRNLEPYDNIVEVVGWTPLVRLKRIGRGLRTPIYGKAENLNPGGSVKDRIGLAIIEGAERRGELKAGGVVVTTGLASLNTYVLKGFWAVILAELLAVAFNSGMYLGAFRALTPKGVPTRQLLPGAITGGICWTVLQVLGTWLVHHFLHSDSLYGVFATVLGLLAWIYLAVLVTVYSAEINVVLSRRLWPRSIVQPPLTEADRASMALQALQNQRRPEQHVEVTFDDRPAEINVPEPRAGSGLDAPRDRAQ